MTAPVTTITTTESPDRISAVDADGIEICGAFRPQGHEHWLIFATARLTDHLHHVIAPTQQIARWHVEMLAQLFATSTIGGIQ